MDFANLPGPTLQKTCTNCGACGRPIRHPYMPCEPCDGSGMVPNEAGRMNFPTNRGRSGELV